MTCLSVGVAMINDEGVRAGAGADMARFSLVAGIGDRKESQEWEQMWENRENDGIVLTLNR